MSDKLSDTVRNDIDLGGAWLTFNGNDIYLADGIAALEQQAEKWELEAKRLYGVGQDIEEMRVALEQRVEGLEGGLGKIVEWSKAYPLDVFPEPDFKKAAELLKAGGMTLDAISASNMRHVVKGVGKIAEEALAAEEEA